MEAVMIAFTKLILENFLSLHYHNLSLVTSLPSHISNQIDTKIQFSSEINVNSLIMETFSIKNIARVAVTVYAVDCVTKMVMDVVPQKVKETYLDPAFNFASNAINDVANNCYQSATDVSDYT